MNRSTHSHRQTEPGIEREAAIESAPFTSLTMAETSSAASSNPTTDPTPFDLIMLATVAPEPLLSPSDYPTIDSTSFDIIVAGTGLPESLLAAAAAVAGKTVLHVDPNPFYGFHFSSFSPAALPSFLRSHRLYSEIDVSGPPPERSRDFLLDLSAPRALYCADPAVDLMLRSGASHHVEFKCVEGSLIWWEGRLCSVPDSRQAIFKDRSLSLAEKNKMMRFMKLVQAQIGADGGVGIAAEDLEIPFAEFLQKQGLPPKIRAIVLYGITLANYDQENADADECKRTLSTKEGLERLALYSSSLARFPNAIGALIYPMYGHGELPQAFCRCAAVKGAVYVLRMPVVGLLVDKESRQYKGVRLASGEDILSHHLVVDPSFTVPSLPKPPTNSPLKGLNSEKPTGKVAKGICITGDSIQRELSNILVIFPPRSLYSEQLTTVHALQISSSLQICPSGRFVVYLSTPCNDVLSGKEIIRAAMNALFLPPDLNNSEGSIPSTTKETSEEESKPTLIWSCVYAQELAQASLGDICSCPMPDENLDYKNLLESTMEIFISMYPQEEYFPNIPASGNAEVDDDLTEQNSSI